ncbi:MAG: Uma2 family endonuclease [Saprospiraceae bacterium]|nr:MAG: Uma2 family endonuclease [Saprospiraceae bacterium]
MVATKVQERTAEAQITEGNVAESPPISWEEFETEYLSREDEFKYEWVRGKVVKTKRTMYQYQYFILDNLMELFLRLHLEKKVTGKLWTEIDTFFLKDAHRRPDMAWFSDEQAARMAHRQNQVPNFIIEIVSDNDNADNLLDKLSDYADAEVEVVWLISPKLEQVHIYSGQNNSVCKGGMICSAAPILPEFQISVNDIFKKPPLPVSEVSKV